MVVTLGRQYHAGEKPTVILCTYIVDRHAGTPENKTLTNKKHCINSSSSSSNSIHPVDPGSSVGNLETF